MISWYRNLNLGSRVWLTYFSVLGATAVLMAGRRLQWWGALLSETALDSLTTTLLSFLVVGFFANLLLIRSVQDGVRETVRETLPQLFTSDDNESVFRKLSPEVRASVVQQVLRAQLGVQYGDVIYSNVVEAYLTHEQDYRDSYVYEIDCKEAIGMPKFTDPKLQKVADGIGRLTKDYLWIEQTCAYKQAGFRVDKIQREFVIRFVFAMRDLEDAVHDKSVAFREILNVSQVLAEDICTLNSSQLGEFLSLVLGFKAFAPDGASLTFSAELVEGVRGKVIEIRVPNVVGMREGGVCHFTFRLPHLRSVGTFVVTLPKPTRPGAKIKFTKADSMRNLSEFTYLSDMQPLAYDIVRVPTSDGKDIGQVQIETRKWTFPVSGVVFFWQ